MGKNKKVRPTPSRTSCYCFEDSRRDVMCHEFRRVWWHSHVNARCSRRRRRLSGQFVKLCYELPFTPRGPYAMPWHTFLVVDPDNFSSVEDIYTYVAPGYIAEFRINEEYAFPFSATMSIKTRGELVTVENRKTRQHSTPKLQTPFVPRDRILHSTL